MSSRLFVLGSGPSIADVDMQLLKDEDTFGCNRLCQWEGLTITPTYYACNVTSVLDGLSPRHPPYGSQRFLCHRGRYAGVTAGWQAVPKSKGYPLYTRGTCLRVHSGGTMAAIVVQLGHWLGYDEMYLLGCEQRDGPHVYGSHVPFYREKGTLEYWTAIHKAYPGVVDCTPGGLLNEVLPYVPLEEVLGVE